MKRFWISWWDTSTEPGQHLPVGTFAHFWVSGQRMDDVGAHSMVALIDAENEDAAWALADVMYPGASSSERRFSNEKPLDYTPGDRFPIREED
jgi:hypothetical protein